MIFHFNLDIEQQEIFFFNTVIKTINLAFVKNNLFSLAKLR